MMIEFVLLVASPRIYVAQINLLITDLWIVVIGFPAIGQLPSQTRDKLDDDCSP